MSKIEENDVENIDAKIAELLQKKALQQQASASPNNTPNINNQILRNLNPNQQQNQPYIPGQQPPPADPNQLISKRDAAGLILQKLNQTSTILIFLAVAPIMCFLIGMFLDIVGLGMAIFFIPLAIYFRARTQREIRYLGQRYGLMIQKDRFRPQLQQQPAYNPQQQYQQQPNQQGNKGGL